MTLGRPRKSWPVEEARQLVAQGASINSVAKRYGMSFAAIKRGLMNDEERAAYNAEKRAQYHRQQKARQIPAGTTHCQCCGIILSETEDPHDLEPGTLFCRDCQRDYPMLCYRIQHAEPHSQTEQDVRAKRGY